MAPIVPRLTTAGQIPVVLFDGAMIVEELRPPTERSFLFRATYYPEHPQLKRLAASGKKPPQHFHPYQHEYFEVLSGRMTVEIAGRELVLSPGSGEVDISPWTHHCIYPTINSGDEKVVTLVSSSDAGKDYAMDAAFFENWYRYQDQIIQGEEKVDMIQVLSMWDAGATYPSLPWWVPFGKYISIGLTVVIGRWLGGLLGYKPYQKEWTTNFEQAEEQMRLSFFQRHLVTAS